MSTLVIPDFGLRIVTISPTVLNNDAYDANDLIFDATAVTAAAAGFMNDPCAILQSITYIDENDNTAANLTFYIAATSTSFGTLDSAPNISAANVVATAIGSVAMASSVVADWGSAKVGHVGNIGLIVPIPFWVAMVSAGTPTHTTALGITVKLGLKRGP